MEVEVEPVAMEATKQEETGRTKPLELQDVEIITAAAPPSSKAIAMT